MTTAGFGNNTVNDIAIDGQDNVWVGTNWGLCRYDGSNWDVFLTSNSGLPDNIIYALATDSLDRVWIGTQQHGVVVYDGSTWISYTTLNSPLPQDQVMSLTIDHRGWVWMGTFLGLVCYTGTEWRIYDDTPSSYDGLLLNGAVIEDVAVRPDGLVAIGTLNGGFHYLTDSMVVVHATYIDLFPDNTQLGVAFDPVNDERWLATPSQGLIRQGGSWYDGPWFQYATWSSTIPTNGLTSVAIDAIGRPWVGSTTSGVIVRQPSGTFNAYTTDNSGIPDDRVSSLAFESNGALWAGTAYGGAARFVQSSSISETAQMGSIRAFPSPFNASFQFHLPAKDPIQWSLFDAIGRLMNEGTSSAGDHHLVDVHELPAGPYLLKVSSPDGSYFSRVIKQ